MFKKILFAALVAISASFAQINFGIHAGVNMNTLWGDDAGDDVSGFGFVAGVGAKISLPLLPLTIAPEVLIDMRNNTAETKTVLGTTETESTEWSLDIPVMIRFSLLPIIFVEAGPVFGFNLSTSVEQDGKEIDDNLLPEYNTFDFALAVGFGTNILPLIDIDFRVNIGFTNVSTEKVTDNEIDASNLQFVLGATYWF